MGKTYLHKESGKFKNGKLGKPSNKLSRKFDRHNFEVGELRNERNKLKYKEYE